MPEGLIDLGIGLLAGGLLMSAAWGLFWLVVGTVGLTRGVSSKKVLVNAGAVTIVPLLLLSIMLWLRGAAPGSALALGAGMSVIPLVLVGLGMRQAPDGRRAGAHMLDGVRHLMDEVLGKHRGCGGCDHDHGQPGSCS